MALISSARTLHAPDGRNGAALRMAGIGRTWTSGQSTHYGHSVRVKTDVQGRYSQPIFERARGRSLAMLSRQLAIASGALALACAACSSQPSPIGTTIALLVMTPAKYDGHVVRVKGFVRWQGLGGPLLYTTHSEAMNAPESEGVDLSRKSGRFSIQHYLSGKQGRCMIVVGLFRAYTNKVITVDTTSKYGQITANKVSRC